MENQGKYKFQILRLSKSFIIFALVGQSLNLFGFDESKDSQNLRDSQSIELRALNSRMDELEKRFESNKPPEDFSLLKIRGFGDFNFSSANKKVRNSSFQLGQLDLFITSQINQEKEILSEVVVEPDQDNKINIELERFLFQWGISDYFNAAFGRYHSAIGYYNTSCHHGKWFQTTVDRPKIFEFEDNGGILPIHNVGISTHGEIPTGPIHLNYIFEVGNGRSSRKPEDEPVQNLKDDNNGKSINIGFFINPDAAPNLQIGFSLYRDRLSPLNSPQVEEKIYSGHVIYHNQKFEFLNEGVVINHNPVGPIKSVYSSGGYSLISYQIKNFRPYYRYQFIDMSPNEPVFPDIEVFNMNSLGIRMDPWDQVSFKLQADRINKSNHSAYHQLTLQWAFAF